MTQDELGRDRLLRAALRRAEPTDVVPEDQDAAMEPTPPDPAPERPSVAGLIRRGDKRDFGPVESDRPKSGKARLNPSQGEKRLRGKLEKIAALSALPAPQSQSSSSAQNDSMQVDPIPDNPASGSSAAEKNRGKPKRKPVGAILLRELQAAEAAAKGSVCAIEIVLAMGASDRLCADAVALAKAYSPERFKPRAGAFCLRAGLALDLNGMGPFTPQAAGGREGGSSP